jgi:MFS family permease
LSTEAQQGREISASIAPERSTLVLVALILVAAVADLNRAVANVALPDIGAAFQSSQTALNLIAVGYSLGLACSVLYFGALGDRYGRKAMLLMGTALAIPMSLLAAWAPTDIVSFLARLGGGLAAGVAFPTTLALITALGRVRDVRASGIARPARAKARGDDQHREAPATTCRGSSSARV